MPIEFKCTCGAVCSADQSKVGQLLHCEACGLDVPVPAPGTADAVRKSDPAATAEMIAQVQTVAPAHGQDLGVLKDEMVAKAAEGVTADEAARRQADRDAFRAQLGQKVGADELLAQIHGIRREAEAPAAPGAAGPDAAATDAGAAPAAPAARNTASATELGKALRLAAPAKPIPTGKARAATHVRVKRVVWAPSLVMGLLCLAGGLYSLDALTLKLVWHRPTLFPPVNTPAPRDMVADDNGDWWALPKGAEAVKHPDGKFWYVNEYGAEEPAEFIKGMKEAVAFDRAQKENALFFAPSFLIVGLALLLLGLWSWNDVRIVKREMGTTEIPTAEMAAGQSPPPAAGAPAAEAGAPAPAAEPAPGTSTEAKPDGAAAPAPEAAAPAPETPAPAAACETPPPPESKPEAGQEPPKQA